MDAWPTGISAMTLFVASKDEAKTFYEKVFGLPVFYEDDVSVVFRFGATLVNLLSEGEVAELIEPVAMASADAGARALLTIDVDDVDAKCAELAAAGVALVNGPVDRPWGVRTASFSDPFGHLWEIARAIS